VVSERFIGANCITAPQNAQMRYYPSISRHPTTSPARSGTRLCSPNACMAGTVQASRLSVTRVVLRGRP
jgi:hypothetical protein